MLLINLAILTEKSLIPIGCCDSSLRTLLSPWVTISSFMDLNSTDVLVILNLHDSLLHCRLDLSTTNLGCLLSG